MNYNEIFSNSHSGGNKQVKFVAPGECPICHKQIEPVYLFGSVDSKSEASVFFYCGGCNKSFISRYELKFKETNIKLYRVHQLLL